MLTLKEEEKKGGEPGRAIRAISAAGKRIGQIWRHSLGQQGKWGRRKSALIAEYGRRGKKRMERLIAHYIFAIGKEREEKERREPCSTDRF